MLTFTINTTENSCHFEHCRYNSEGGCLSYAHRLDCIEIALKTLCAESYLKDVSEKISKNKKDFPDDE